MIDYKIRGENIEVTEALDAYTKKRLDKLERTIGEDNPIAHVNLRTYPGKGETKAEVTIVLPYLTLRAESREADLYQAIDFVAAKLERQLRKYKTKINRKSRETGYKGIDESLLEPSLSEPVNEELPIEITREKHVEDKPMSVEEAILQMDLTQHDFYLFHDAETDKMAVVYRRADKTYGILYGEE